MQFCLTNCCVFEMKLTSKSFKPFIVLHIFAATSDGKKHALDDNGITEEKVIVVNNTFMSVPLLIALCICLLLIVGLIYRFKFAARGKPKKVPVDDGDYLINGMYL
eukprot:TCONS_00042715-protein